MFNLCYWTYGLSSSYLNVDPGTDLLSFAGNSPFWGLLGYFGTGTYEL